MIFRWNVELFVEHDRTFCTRDALIDELFVPEQRYSHRQRFPAEAEKRIDFQTGEK